MEGESSKEYASDDCHGEGGNDSVSCPDCSTSLCRRNPEPLRNIRDVHRTALRTFRGVVSLREHLDSARHHEGGVKTHSKLPDDVARVLAGVLQEIQDLALCYDADVLNDLIVSRTCACALDRKGVSGLNDLRPIPIRTNSPAVCLQESELLARTWSLGDDLLDENLLASVERLGHDAQELLPYRHRRVRNTNATFMRRSYTTHVRAHGPEHGSGNRVADAVRSCSWMIPQGNGQGGIGDHKQNRTHRLETHNCPRSEPRPK